MNKNKITLMILTLTASIYANSSSFLVVVDKDHNEYEHDEGTLIVETSPWKDVGSEKCSVDLTEDQFYYGEAFTQTEDCDQEQERTITTYREFSNGNKTVESVTKETQTVTETNEYDLVGTHLENTCLDILNNNYSNGDGTYRVLFNGGMDVYCDMTRNGGGWTRLSNYDFSKNPDNIPPNLVKTVNRTITAYHGGQHTFRDGWYPRDITAVDYTQFNWTEIEISSNGQPWTQTMIDMRNNFEISTDGYRVYTASRDSTSVNGQYLDGASLTYGYNGARNHLYSVTNITSDVERISWLNNSDSNVWNNYGTNIDMFGSNAYVSGVKASGTESISVRLMVNQLWNDEMSGLRMFKVWIR